MPIIGEIKVIRRPHTLQILQTYFGPEVRQKQTL